MAVFFKNAYFTLEQAKVCSGDCSTEQERINDDRAFFSDVTPNLMQP